MNLARALTWPLDLAARLLQIPDDALDVWDDDDDGRPQA